jgi:Eukaryotic aspartyl protease
MATRIKLTVNPKYQRNGTKSYAHLLRKYRFSPTKDGPFFHGTRLEQQDRYIPFTNCKIPLGGKVRIVSVLQKKEGGQIGEVSADDIQNDSMYLATVEIGVPAQSLNLDFDTGSADLWVGYIS